MKSMGAATLAVAAFLAVGSTGIARAEDMQFAGRTIGLAPPQGYCALDPKRPQEAKILDEQAKLQQQSELALLVLDCKELDQLRAGAGFDPTRYGTVLVLEQQGEVRPIADMTREQFVAAVAKPLQQTDLDAVRSQLVDHAEPSAASNGLRVLGVLKQDERAAYLAVAIDSVNVDAKAVPAAIVGVTAVTLVDQLPVSLNLYHVNGGADAFPSLLADQQHNVEALLNANSAAGAEVSGSGGAPAAGRVPLSLKLDSAALEVAIIAGLAALAAIVAATMLRRRKRPSLQPKEPIPPV